MKKSPLVAIERCDTYAPDDLDTSIARVCEAAQLPNVRDKRVLLKPNILSDALPERAVTTRPELIASLIRFLYAQGAAQVLVGDSPGIHGPGFSPKLSGIARVCDEEGALWCDFAKDSVLHRIPGSFGLSLPLPRILKEVDCVISVAKMKTHQLMYVTGSVKNLFGMVPGLHKSSCHMRYPTRASFAKMLAGLYSVISPHFAVMDAIVSMEGPGPAGGMPRHTGLILASSDPTALDVAQSIIMGYDPLSIDLTRELKTRNLTNWHSVEDIEYPLLHASDLVISDYKRIRQERRTRLFGSLLSPLFTRRIKLRQRRHEPKPLFDSETCIGCGRCVQICPGKALSLDKDRHIMADYSACIRCYCCHEVCPVDAITIENNEGID